MVVRYDSENAIIDDSFYSGIIVEKEDINLKVAEKINNVLDRKGWKEYTYKLNDIEDVKKGNILKIKSDKNSKFDENFYVVDDIFRQEELSQGIRLFYISVCKFDSDKSEKLMYMNNKNNPNSMVTHLTSDRGIFELRIVSDVVLSEVYNVKNEKELISSII